MPAGVTPPDTRRLLGTAATSRKQLGNGGRQSFLRDHVWTLALRCGCPLAPSVLGSFHSALRNELLFVWFNIYYCSGARKSNHQCRE